MHDEPRQKGCKVNFVEDPIFDEYSDDECEPPMYDKDAKGHEISEGSV